MPDNHTLFRWILGPGGRAIIFDSTRRRIQVERNFGAHEKFVNFPGGGKEVGETLQEGISREMEAIRDEM
jgi:ADP-ribose pyrophosphatase YjhB (NUDIX family)